MKNNRLIIQKCKNSVIKKNRQGMVQIDCERQLFTTGKEIAIEQAKKSFVGETTDKNHYENQVRNIVVPCGPENYK